MLGRLRVPVLSPFVHMSKVNSDLAAAIAAASIAGDGPDIDGALEEIVAAEGSSV